MRHVSKNASGVPFVTSNFCFLFVLAGALLASGPARADLLSKPDPMQGYYLGVGVEGSSSTVYSDETGWLKSFFGPGGTIHVGQGIAENLALGLNVAAGFERNRDRTLLVGQFGIELKWRFYRSFFVRPALGFGFTDPTRRKQDLEKILPGVTGSYSIEFGYDYFASVRGSGSGGLALNPVFFVNAKNGTSLTAVQWGIGIEVTFWTGLPKNQLILPVEKAYESE